MLHAPQSPSAHPSFVPLRSFSILNQSNKLEFGSELETSTLLLFKII